MACNHNLKKRLLLSTIRAPTRNRLPFSEVAYVQSRSIHATRWSQSQGFSISFGPELDRLIHPEKEKTNVADNVPSETVKSWKTNEKTKSSNGSKLETHKTHGQNNVNPTRTDLQARHHQNKTMRSSYGYTDTPASSSDQTAIEIIDNTNVMISKSATTHFRSPKSSPKHSASTNEASQRRPQSREASIQHSKIAASNSQPRKRSEQWQIQKDALQKKFGEDGWKPRKKLSPDAMEGIRSLHEQDPDHYSTPVLAQQFKMSPEAIRRILKSKWRPSEEGMEKRRERWARRHDRIWDQKAALGLRPARRTIRQTEGPEAFEEEMKAKQALGQI